MLNILISEEGLSALNLILYFSLGSGASILLRIYRSHVEVWRSSRSFSQALRCQLLHGDATQSFQSMIPNPGLANEIYQQKPQPALMATNPPNLNYLLDVLYGSLWFPDLVIFYQGMNDTSGAKMDSSDTVLNSDIVMNFEGFISYND